MLKLFKYFLLGFLFFLYCIPTFAQRYELTIEGYVNDGGRSCGSERGLVYIEATHEDGSTSGIFYPSVFENRELSVGPISYYEDNKITSLTFHTNRRRRNSVGDCRSRRNTGVLPIPNGCFSRDYNFSEFESRVGGNAIVNVRPIIEISSDFEDIAGYEDPLFINATQGFPADFYQWQYQLEDGGWTDIVRQSPIQYPHILEFVPENYLPTSEIGKRINFRIVPCEGELSENVVSYLIRRSAPHITGIFRTDVSCYDGSDGSVKLTFDRPLDAGDNLSIAIEDLATNNVVPIPGLNNLSSLDVTNSITINNLPPGDPALGFKVILLGSYNGELYYTGDDSHTAEFTVLRPENPVDFQITETINVWCNDDDGDPESNNDGEIHITASGGGPGTYEYSINEEGTINEEWYSFTNTTTHAIKNLKSNVNYEIRVRKKVKNGSVYCIAKNQQLVNGKIELGSEKILRQSLVEPDQKLTIEFVDDKWPAAYGYSDGYIKARVYGGTIFDDNSYDFEWQNSKGDVFTTDITEYVVGQGYFITLNNIPSDIYYLTVRDKNYSNATYQLGCYVNDSKYFLDQPEKLIVEIKETKNISCNSENIYRDPYSDGELTAEAQGGIQLDFTVNRGFPYYYAWQKKDNTGNWQVISETEARLRGAGAGEYRVIITDANGITTEQLYTLQQPDLLEIQYSKTDLDCDYENKGSISISITGGVPGYEIQWSNGETTPQIQDLTAGTYMVYVTDSRGCQAIEEITINQPEGIEIQALEQRNPTCFEANDGAIHVEVTGGTAPYTYLWNTGDTNPFITDLTEGKYELKITDAKGCMAYSEYILENPAPLVVNLGEDRTICLDQGIIYDITIDDPGAIYSWESDNGFSSTSPIVELTEEGTYRATVVTSQGCKGSDELIMNVSDKEIDSYFLLTTQAFAKEEVILVNVSEFLGESVEWTVPEGVEKVFSDKEGLIVYFEEPGSYDINLRSFQGSCYQDYTKRIIVEEAADLPYTGGSDSNFINEFIVYPNPTDGEFKVKVSLAEASDISIKIISLTTSSVMHSRTEKSTREYLLDYNLNLVPGMYIMLLETPQGKEIRKMIFN